MSEQEKWAEDIRDLREEALLEGPEWDHVDAALLFFAHKAYRHGVMAALQAVPDHPPAHIDDAWRIRIFEGVIAALSEDDEDDEDDEDRT